MPRLTLRTLLAYIDDTLEPVEARALGKKVAESDEARLLVDRIKRVTRRRGLAAPEADDEDDAGDPNTVAEYLDNALDSNTLRQVEETCLESDVHLAEVAACHQILTLVLTEPVRVPPQAHHRMYQLVGAPASVPNRRPNKTLPISAAAPPADGPVDADEADAALLLGMKRYSATTNWAARLALFGAAAGLLVLLAWSVRTTLSSPQTPEPPEMAARPDATPPTVPVAPAPAPGGPIGAPKPKEPEPPVMPMPVPVPPGGEAVVAAPAPPPPVDPPWDKIDPPNPRRDDIGRLDTDRVLVVTRRDGVWGRQLIKRADDLPGPNSVFSSDPVMALPGYKANVLLGPPNKPTVEVHLWGNAPEQLPYRVLESEVTFHQPAPNFDADFTLHAGRVYLQNLKALAEKKPVPVKVRVRLGSTGEVWDVTLPDERADVLVELISWFEPGTPYALKGGKAPKREVRLAVVKGTAAVNANGRFKPFDRIDAGTQLAWDSVKGGLDPGPIPNPQEVLRVPVLDGEFQKVLNRILTNMADAVTDPERVRTALKVRLDPPQDLQPRDLVARLAVYAWAAMADSDEAGSKSLQELVDILNSELPWLSRQAAVTALVQWVARDPGNTALLHALMSKPGTGLSPLSTADAVVEMLRCYVSPTHPSPDRLDALVERLAGAKGSEFDKPEKAVALRDVALWNLVAADLGVWIPPPIGVNVGAAGTKFDDPRYKEFVNDWKTRVDRIKKRPPPKMP